MKIAQQVSIVHESEYGDSPMNFHVTKRDDTLEVALTYPPRTAADNKNNRCRYLAINQEAVRASDGIRVHYDYERDGFVVEQPQPRLLCVGPRSYEEPDDWIEVGFFQSWQFDNRKNGAGDWTQEEFERADAEWEANKQKKIAP